MQKKILDGIKVFDFGWAVAGSYTTKLLADYGATVIKLETETHVDFLRTNGFIKGTSKNDPNDKPFAGALNTSKYSLALNLKNPQAKEIIARFYQWADIVFENFSPGKINEMGLGYEYAKSVNPNIIMCHFSIFGQFGPLARQAGTDGIGSSMAAHRGLTGWPDRTPEPCSPMVLGDTMCPFFNAASIVAALDYRNRTGKGQEIDCSMLDILSAKAAPSVMNYVSNGVVDRRNGNHVAYAAPHAAYRCQGDDRWVAIAAYSDRDWNKLREVMGDPDWAKNDAYATLTGRKEHEDFIDEQITLWTQQYTPEYVMELLQSNGLAAGVVQTQEDIIEKDPQVKAREYFTTTEHTIWGTLHPPRPPFVMSENQASIFAPADLGQHTFKVCSEILGMSDEEFVKYDQQGVFK